MNSFRPAFSINLDKYISALQRGRHLVLTEQNFVERVHAAFVGSQNRGSWHEAAGITCWQQLFLDELVHECLAICCSVAKSEILVVVLTPFGESLSASDTSRRQIRRNEQEVFWRA